MPPVAAGALIGAAVCLLAAPYLAGLTLSVPDRTDREWWRGRRGPGRRILAIALIGLFVGGLAGAAAGWTATLPAFLALALASVPLIVIDLEHHRLPDRLVLPAAVAGLVLLAAADAVRNDWHSYLRGLAGGALVYAVLLVLALLPGGGFGYGDVKLGGVLGLYLGTAGWSNLYLGIFAGFLLGTVIAVPLLLTGRATRKTPVPFGPLLVLGALLVLALRLAPSVP